MHCSLYLRAVAWPWLRMRQHQLGEWRKEVVKSCSFLYINFFYFYYLFLSRCRLWCIINVAVNVSNNGQKGKPFSDMQFFLCACRMKGKWVSGAAYRYGKTNCLWWIVEKQYFFFVFILVVCTYSSLNCSFMQNSFEVAMICCFALSKFSSWDTEIS